MKKSLLITFFLVYCVWFLSIAATAQSPVITSVTPNTPAPARLDKFELTINLTAAYTNAYDYNDISVQCIFFAPGGRKDTVDGFFMQDYILNPDGAVTPSGSGSFKVRYAPNATGTWTYILSCKNTSGTATQPAQSFQCVSSAAAGFIRKNTTNYLNFDNGEQFIPIGENMGWQNTNVVSDYTDWLTRLSDNNGNFIRVWMSSWAFALEWKNGSNGFSGLKKYRQTSAYYLDWLLDYCKQKNVYLMLTLNNHGQVSTTVNQEWADNPYNIVNGGPAANPWNFFTDASAKAIHKNRLRYIIARYAYSQNIQSWELFNEVDWTDQFNTRKADVKDWHNEMAIYIKSKDVYQHLVTTSYAHDYNDPALWDLPDIDFTQTHFYINSPDIESVLSAASQNYINNYQKPTLNGEFGLGPAGPTLSANDPAGIHIHNSIWGSMFSGALGSAMTWWWDDYINPQDLYHHYKPLAVVASSINFKDDNYKKGTAGISGGGNNDIVITPGADFGAATSSSFSIDANGVMTPGSAELGRYLFGSVFNTQYHNPPSFNVTYPVSGQFEVVTGSGAGTSPMINIYVDGVELLNQAAMINTSYAVNVTAGVHVIKVDNLGTDWIMISSYTFTNIAPPLAAYVLRSADTYRAAGWLLNSKYNWQYLQSNGVAPAPITGSNLSIPGMHNGNYTISFYSTGTGDLLYTSALAVTTGTLMIPLPDIDWDIAFKAVENSVLPVRLYSFTGKHLPGGNYLYIDIANGDYARDVFLERSPDGINFKSLSIVSASWNSVMGKHQYIDNAPLKGLNFYRLKMIDKDGSVSYSQIIKLVNDLVKFSIYPNPANDNVILKMDEGSYHIHLTDETGRIVSRKSIKIKGEANALISLATWARGIYYISVYNNSGDKIGYGKIIK